MIFNTCKYYFVCFLIVNPLFSLSSQVSGTVEEKNYKYTNMY